MMNHRHRSQILVLTCLVALATTTSLFAQQPAPNGPIYLVMRLYWPTDTPPSILPPGEGTWKPPGVVASK
jgi:hypothetical protein